MKNALLWAAAPAAAFWPVWSWQIERMRDGSDEPWGILALITIAVHLILFSRPAEPGRFQLGVAAALTLVYAALFSHLPPLLRALLAILVMSLLLSSWQGSKRVHFALLGLLTLSLPIIASLQFYLGYPVRFATASLAAGVLSAIGYPTEASGTALNWCGEIIVVDAPCAGIRMLWSGLYVAFSAALFRNFSFLLTWLSYIIATAIIFFGNLVRNILLFFTESKIVPAPEWMHSAIGLFTFSIVVIFILQSQKYLARRSEHALL